MRVTVLNCNEPEFFRTPYSITPAENTALNTTVFTEVAARDNEIEYTVVRGNEEENNGYFATNLPHQVSEITIGM